MRAACLGVLVIVLYYPDAPACAADYAIGADLSFLKQAEDRGTVFKDAGKTQPGLLIFKDHGYNWVRLRLFHSPKSLPNNLDYTIALAKAARGRASNSCSISITPTPGPTRASNSRPQLGRESRTTSWCGRSSSIRVIRSQPFARRACRPTWCKSATRSSTACSGPTASCPRIGTALPTC